MSDARRDAIGAAVFVAVGAAGLAGIRGLPFGDGGLPGPAMLPTVLSALIVVLALVHLARAIGRLRAAPDGGAGPGGQAAEAPVPGRYRRVALASLVIAAYVCAAAPFGFLATTFGAMSALYAIGVEERVNACALGRALLAGAALTAATWLLFGVLLDVPLPHATLLE